ncbi:RNA-directed DNA polymerase, eukaryota [Tanacetum coccineum]
MLVRLGCGGGGGGVVVEVEAVVVVEVEEFHLNDEEEEEGEFVASEVEGVAETVFGDNSAASMKLKPNTDDPNRVGMPRSTIEADGDFYRPVRGGVEKDQLTGLAAILDTMSLSPSLDRWVCSLSSDGDFCIKDARTNIDDMFLPSHNDSTRWVKGVPIKINIFAWRARRDCLPTRLNLIRRDVTLETASCPICHRRGGGCFPSPSFDPLASGGLNANMQKVGVLFGSSGRSSFSEWLDWFSDIRLTSKVKSLIEGVFMVAWWAIWSFRNRSIFETSPPNRSVIFDDIVSHTFLWCYNRCNRSITWDSWFKNPHLIFF